MSSGLTARVLGVSAVLLCIVIAARADGQDPNWIDPKSYTIRLTPPTDVPLNVGTGFVIGDRLDSLFIATAGHVVAFEAKDGSRDCPEADSQLPHEVVLNEQQFYNATVKYCRVDNSIDLAVLEVKVLDASVLKDIPHAIISPAPLRPVRDKVRLFGNFSSGETPEYRVRGVDNGLLLVETDIVPPGASGGPVINACGHLVAMAIDEGNEAIQEMPSVASLVDLFEDLQLRHKFAFELAPAPGPCKKLAPEKPAGLEIELLSLSKVKLTWQDLPNEKGYRIEQVHRDGGGAVAWFRTRENENWHVSEEELEPGGSYEFSVYGWNDGTIDREGLKAVARIRMFPRTNIRFPEAVLCQGRWLTRAKSVDVMIETDASFEMQARINGIALTVPSKAQKKVALDLGANPLSIEFGVDGEDRTFEILSIPDGIRIESAQGVDGAVVSEHNFELSGRVLVPGIAHVGELFPEAKIALRAYPGRVEPQLLAFDTAGHFQDQVPLRLGVNRLELAVDDCQGETTRASWSVHRILPAAPRLSHQWAPKSDQFWPETMASQARGTLSAGNELRRLLVLASEGHRRTEQALAAQVRPETSRTLELPDGNLFTVFSTGRQSELYVDVSGHQELLLRGENLSVAGGLNLVGDKIVFAGSFTRELENWFGGQTYPCPGSSGCSFLAFTDEQRDLLEITHVLGGVRVHHLAVGFDGLLLAGAVETPGCAELYLGEETACLAAIEGAATYIVRYDLQGVPTWATAPPIEWAPVAIIPSGAQGMLLLSHGASQEQTSMVSFFKAIDAK